jgi:hypothetical protein
MKQNIPGAVAVVIAIIVGVLVVVFGFRKVSGADKDVTQETIDRYQNMSKQTFSGQGSNGGGPSQMTHGQAPANAPAKNTGSSQ